MELTKKQEQQVNKFMTWYPKKVSKVYKMIQEDKITKDNFWDQARKITKNVYSDKSIREWQIVFETMEELFSN
jgi:hypothetical protein